MKTIVGLAALVTTLTLAGCAGTLDCLRSDRDFEAYAERMNLRNLSVEDAAAVLVADGYQCEKKPPIAFEAAIVMRDDGKISIALFVGAPAQACVAIPECREDAARALRDGVGSVVDEPASQPNSNIRSARSAGGRED